MANEKKTKHIKNAFRLVSLLLLTIIITIIAIIVYVNVSYKREKLEFDKYKYEIAQEKEMLIMEELKRLRIDGQRYIITPQEQKEWETSNSEKKDYELYEMDNAMDMEKYLVSYFQGQYKEVFLVDMIVRDNGIVFVSYVCVIDDSESKIFFADIEGFDENGFIQKSDIDEAIKESNEY